MSESGVAVLSLTAHFSVCSHPRLYEEQNKWPQQVTAVEIFRQAQLRQAQPGSAHYCRRGANGTAQMQMSPEEKRGDMYLCPENI